MFVWFYQTIAFGSTKHRTRLRHKRQGYGRCVGKLTAAESVGRDLQDPFDMREIGRRIDGERRDLGIDVKKLMPAIPMSESTYSLKWRFETDPRTGAVYYLSTFEVNAILAAYRKLVPGYRPPPGFPYISRVDAEKLVKKRSK